MTSYFIDVYSTLNQTPRSLQCYRVCHLLISIDVMLACMVCMWRDIHAALKLLQIRNSSTALITLCASKFFLSLVLGADMMEEKHTLVVESLSLIVTLVLMLLNTEAAGCSVGLLTPERQYICYQGIHSGFTFRRSAPPLWRLSPSV